MIATQLNIEEFKRKVIDQILIAISFIGVLAITVLAFRESFDIWSGFFFIQSSIILALIITTYFRNYFSINSKINLILFAALIVTNLGLLNNGFLASGKLYILFVPIFSSFFLGYRSSLAWLVFYLLSYGTFGFLYSSGILTLTKDVNAFLVSPSTWIFEALVFSISSFCLLYLSKAYQKQIRKSLRTITEKESALRDSESKYRTLFENAQDAILLFDNGYFSDCNEKACEIFGLKKYEIIGKSPIELSPPVQADGQKSEDKANELIVKAMAGEPQFFEWQHYRSNGEVFDLAISLKRVDLEEKMYGQAILRDVTIQKQNERELSIYRENLEQLVKERTEQLEVAVKNLNTTNQVINKKSKIIEEQNVALQQTIKKLHETQAQLIQTEKMASLGVLTAGVAHEINNPLNYIMGSYAVIKKKLQQQKNENHEETLMFLESMKTGVQRASNIVGILNQFGRNSDSMDEYCDINRIVSDCLIMIQHETRDRIEVNVRLCKPPSSIQGNSGSLHQMLINILMNSIQSIKDTGELSISTKKNANTISIIVEDTGCGIRPEDLPKIMDPFFTTKQQGEGTGLGLTMSQSIIQKHQGTLQFESTVNKGTTAIITFPLI